VSRSIENFRPAAPRCAALILALALAFAGASCNSKNPVAPETPLPPGGGGPGSGTYTITLTASPAALVAGSTDGTTLTATATNSSSQSSPPDGTPCAFSTSLGSFDQTKAMTLITINFSGGKAVATLFPSTTTGTATVLAQIDTSSRQLSVPIRAADQTFFIASISPASGKPDGGTPVTITGAGFVQTMRVTFGGIAATTLNYVSATQLTAKTPPPPSVVAAGTAMAVDVTVSKASGASTTSDTLPGGFIYANNGNGETPVIFSVAPALGSNDGGTTLAISGSGFVSPVAVKLGTSALGYVTAAVSASTDSSITAVTPAASAKLQGKAVDVVVTNSGSGASATLKSGFQYENTQFFISSVSATSGPYTGGTAVKIMGQGFLSPVAVNLGGIAQPSPAVISSTEIDLTTGAAPVTACNPPSGTVSVTNLSTGTTATSTFNFTYTVTSPRLTSLSPASGKQVGGESITLNGSGFDSSGRVTFGSATSQSVSVGATTTATAPAFTGTLLTETCDDNHDGVTGKRNLPTAVDVTFASAATGCSDTLAKSYTYNPTDTSCIGDSGSGGGSPPVADFTFRNSNFVAGAVDFFDTSTNNPTQWTWDFGDPTSGSSNVSQDQNPIHSFMGGNKTYQVRLTAKNAAGTGTVQKSVTIPLPP
jgi:PKD repeat protein